MKQKSFRECMHGVFIVTSKVLFFISISFILNGSPHSVFAADGSGSASVSPTSALAGSTTNTFTTVYTASEAIKDGGIKITAPAGWSAPQTTSGTAGYVTLTTSGTLGRTENTMDSFTGWADNSALITTSLDTSVKKEGIGSIKAAIGVSTGNGQVFYTYGSPQNWSSYNKVSFWFRSSTLLSAGDLDLLISENTSLTSATRFDLPTGFLSALSTNAWTHVVVDLSGELGTTRDAVRSVGFEIPVVALSNFYFDNMSLGPNNIPIISGQTIEAPIIELSSGGKVTVKYGQGGGSSGVSVGASVTSSTIATQSKVDLAGTYTNLSVSPQVNIASSTGTASIQFTTQPTSISAGLTMSPVVLTLLDYNGNTATGDNSTNVTLGLSSAPSGGVLSGTTTATASSGVVTFNAVSPSIPGSGYQLSASATGISPITSTSTLTALGVVLSETSGTTSIAEAGLTDTFNAVLNAVPTANVTASFSHNGQLSLSAPSVTFTSSTWSTPQAVTITAISDGLIEGGHTAGISTTVTSSDVRFNGTATIPLLASITDTGTIGVPAVLAITNQPTSISAGISMDPFVIQIQDVFGALVPTTGTQVTIALLSAPTNATLSGTTTVSVTSGTATFSNLSVDLPGGPYTFRVTASGMVSDTSDPYIAMGVVVGDTSISVTEGGITDVYTLALTHEPTDDVTVTITPDDNEVTTSPSFITFDDTNWDDPTTVTITAFDDTENEGIHGTSITHSVVSDDEGFHGTTNARIVVAIADNDSSGGGGGGGGGARGSVGGTTTTTTQQEDVDGDGTKETATDSDGNKNNGYERYSGGRNTKDIVAIDGDEDGKIDHFIDTNKDGVPDKYWDPDNKVKGVITLRDDDGDGTKDWEYDADGDGKADHYYSTKTRKVSKIKGVTTLVAAPAASSSTCILYGNGGTVVKMRSKGVPAWGVQMAVNEMNVIDTPLVVDSLIGPKSMQAVQIAQKLIGTKPDGIWGNITQGIYAAWVQKGCPKIR